MNADATTTERSRQELASFIGPDLWGSLIEIRLLADAIVDATADGSDIRDYAKHIEQEVAHLTGAALALFEALRIDVDMTAVGTATATPAHITHS